MILWCAEWRSKNKLDGVNQHLMTHRYGKVNLFKTRTDCRKWINKEYGYIKTRKDLRCEPHGWRLPVAVKVEIRKVSE